MKKIKDLFFYFYILALIIVSVLMLMKHVEAGRIRKMQVSEDKSGIVTLAFSRNTVISFLSRPEKVVAGSPQAIEVNFIGKDLNVRALQGHPGNLTVYTKSGRMVLLLQMGNENNYDDVVEIVPYSSMHRLRLLKDTYK